jgi:hypothetical protein
MFFRVVKVKNINYGYLVENTRQGDKVNQKILIYFGVVTDKQIPYLKAAYSKIQPKLVSGDQDDKK